eukprot:6317983-Prymnesium_polylepis.1
MAGQPPCPCIILTSAPTNFGRGVYIRSWRSWVRGRPAGDAAAVPRRHTHGPSPLTLVHGKSW